MVEPTTLLNACGGSAVKLQVVALGLINRKVASSTQRYDAILFEKHLWNTSTPDPMFHILFHTCVEQDVEHQIRRRRTCSKDALQTKSNSTIVE